MTQFLLSFVRLLRPAHWIKNLVCLAGMLFYAQFQAVVPALLVALSFTLVSCTVYILNDIFDIERDRTHPKKKSRPLAAGMITIQTAWSAAILLALSALILGFTLRISVGCCCTGYLVLNLAYTLKLKHLPVADAFCIALGFVLRLLAGIYVLDRLPGAWLTLCTFFLSLFLGFAKRRAELVAMEDNTQLQERRPVLDHYSLSFLDGALDATAALAIICYALFLLLPGPQALNPSLVVTVPLVVFMMLHYRRRLAHPRYRIEPNRIIYHDRVMQGCAFLWLVLYLLIQQSGVAWFQ